MMTNAQLAIAILSVSMLSSSTALAQGIHESYTLVELPGLAGSTHHSVAAVNNTGAIAGSNTTGGVTTMVTWDSSGVPVNLGVPPGSTHALVLDINDEGSILLQATGPVSQRLILTYDDILLTLLAPSGTDLDEIGGTINSSGEVGGVVRDPVNELSQLVVWSRTPSGMVPAVVGALDSSGGDGFQSPVMTDSGLVLSGAQSPTGGASPRFFDPRTGAAAGSIAGGLGDNDYTLCQDANDLRVGIGFAYETGSPAIAYVSRVGGPQYVLRPINCPSGSLYDCYPDLETDQVIVTANAMNDQNVVVGSSDIVVIDSGGTPLDPEGPVACAWSADTGTIELSSLIHDGSADGWVLDTAIDINELGWIVGNGLNSAGIPSAFLLLPALPCAGDANRDGAVTPADFSAWVAAFNSGCN